VWFGFRLAGLAPRESECSHRPLASTPELAQFGLIHRTTAIRYWFSDNPVSHFRRTTAKAAPGAQRRRCGNILARVVAGRLKDSPAAATESARGHSRCPADGLGASAEPSLDDPCWWPPDKILEHYRSAPGLTPKVLATAATRGQIRSIVEYFDLNAQPIERTRKRLTLEILQQEAPIDIDTLKLVPLYVSLWLPKDHVVMFWEPGVKNICKDKTRKFESAEEWFYGHLDWLGARAEFPKDPGEMVKDYQVRLRTEGEKATGKKLAFSTLRKMYYDRSKRSK
jgi:hypothetical protein